MPELPEVETVKRTLNQLVVGKTIHHVEIRLPRIIQEPHDSILFAALLEKQTIHQVLRRGKFLRFICDDWVLVSHLRMEGRYGLFQSNEPLEAHVHVIFSFEDGTELRYKDVRQFGTMHIYPIGEDLKSKPLKQLGIEPLEDQFTAEKLRELLAHRTSAIKPLLLNQAYVVGIGNIYADETLFRAGIHPMRSAASLTEVEYHRLHTAIIETLCESVEVGGSSVKSYVNGQGEIGLFQHQLRIYGRKGEACQTCGALIKKMVLAGRGTHLCEQCQPYQTPSKS